MKNISTPRTIALVASCLLSASVQAEVKVGYVKTDRIIQDAPAAIRAGKKLENEFSQRDGELKRLAAEIQSRQEWLAKNDITLSSGDRRAKERELNELSREFQRRKQGFQEDLAARQNEESSALIEKANGAIKRIAEAEGFDLILQDAAYFADGIDITGKVIHSLSDDN